MTIEGLAEQSCPDVPGGECLVTRSRVKHTTELGKQHLVHTVHMSSEIVSALLEGDVIESQRVVHSASDEKVSGKVEVQAPHGLGIAFDSPGAGNVLEVPQFNGAISRGSGEVCSVGMEGDIGYPVVVSLSRHNEFSPRKRPYFPGHII